MDDKKEQSEKISEKQNKPPIKAKETSKFIDPNDKQFYTKYTVWYDNKIWYLN